MSPLGEQTFSDGSDSQCEWLLSQQQQLWTLLLFSCFGFCSIVFFALRLPFRRQLTRDFPNVALLPLECWDWHDNDDDCDADVDDDDDDNDDDGELLLLSVSSLGTESRTEMPKKGNNEVKNFFIVGGEEITITDKIMYNEMWTCEVLL